MTDLVISYFDVDVYDRDVKLLQPSQWLNDTCINYCFKRLMNENIDDTLVVQYREHNVVLLDPCLVSFIRLQCEDEDEFEDLRLSLNLEQKTWLFIPINDNQSFGDNSNHWSSLLCNLETRDFWYYDSLNTNPNLQSAKNFLPKLLRLLQW